MKNASSNTNVRPVAAQPRSASTSQSLPARYPNPTKKAGTTQRHEPPASATAGTALVAPDWAKATGKTITMAPKHEGEIDAAASVQ